MTLECNYYEFHNQFEMFLKDQDFPLSHKSQELYKKQMLRKSIQSMVFAALFKKIVLSYAHFFEILKDLH